MEGQSGVIVWPSWYFSLWIVEHYCSSSSSSSCYMRVCVCINEDARQPAGNVRKSQSNNSRVGSKLIHRLRGHKVHPPQDTEGSLYRSCFYFIYFFYWVL